MLALTSRPATPSDISFLLQLRQATMSSYLNQIIKSSNMIKETIRLHFSPLDSNHIEKLLVIYNDTLTMEYIPNNPSNWTKVELENKFSNNAEDLLNGTGIYAVTEKVTGTLIGQAGIYNSFDSLEHLEIGYILYRDFWNIGYGTEICNVLIKHCFEQLHAKSVTARMYSTNTGSIRVAQKSGMTFVEQKVLDNQLYRLTYIIERSK